MTSEGERQATQLTLHAGERVRLCDLKGCIDISVDEPATIDDFIEVKPGHTSYPAIVELAGLPRQPVWLKSHEVLQDLEDVVEQQPPWVSDRAADDEAEPPVIGDSEDFARSIAGDAVTVICSGPVVEMGPLIALDEAVRRTGGGLNFHIVGQGDRSFV